MTASMNQLPDSHFIANSKGIHTPRPIGFFIERYKYSYLNIMKKFIDCLISQKDIPNGSKEGLYALAIALAAKKSIKEKRIISVDEILEI